MNERNIYLRRNVSNIVGVIRVLYVDDEPPLLEVGKLFLEAGGGFEVDTLISAKAALEQLKTGRYDTIISDYQMPDIDGISFLKQVRSQFGSLPFILFTGRGREEIVIQAINSGADFYLQKGGDAKSQFAELAHKIRQAVGRRQAEISLRESEDRFSRAIAGTSAGLWDWDMVSDRFFFSPQWKMMLGYEDHEVENNFTGWKNLWHPDDAARIGKAVNDYLEGKMTKFEIEHRLRHKDGSWHWIMTRGDIHRDAAGKPVHWTGTNIDVTDRRQAEEEREKALAILQSALSQSPSGILIADAPDVKIRWANEAAFGIRGESELPLTGIDVAQHAISWQTYRIDGTPLPPEDLPLSRSILKGETIRNQEVIIRHASGEDRYVSANSAPIRNAAGEITAGIVVFHDITDRRRAEDNLRESEDRYRNFITNASEGIFRIDFARPPRIDQPRDHLIQDIADNAIVGEVNGALARMYGLKPGDMTGHPVREFAPDCGTQMADLLDTPDFRIIERDEHEIGPDGTPLFIIESYFGVVENGLLKRVWGVQRNVTDRKMAETALRESEELLRDIIEKNPMSIQIVDREGFTLQVNPAFMRLFGSVPPPDFSIITDLVKSRPELESLISQVKSGEPVILPDMSFNPHDIYPALPDVPTRVRAIIFPLNDRYGKLERFVFMHENITGQKQVEEALQESRQILEAIIDNVPARVFWKDKNLTYLGCNTAFARDAGFGKPEEVIGKDDYAMGWRDQAGLYRADDRHVIESGNAKLLIEEPQTTPSGEQISLLTSKVPLRDAAGTIIGVLGTYLDVTERKRAAEELKESEASYRGLFNTIRQALYILDREGKFVDVNEGAEQMYGYTREEFIGRTPEFLSAPGKNDLPAVVEKIQKAFAGEPQEFGFWGLRKSGEEFPKDVYLNRGTYFGEEVVLAIGIDISDRRQAQELIRESEEKYRLLADNLPEYVFIHREGTLLYVNRAVEEVTGMTAAELTRHSVMDFIAPESKALVAEKIRQHVLGEQSCRYEAAIQVKNTKKLYGLVNSIQIIYNGSPASLVVVTDIDERKTAEQNLKESEERYHNLIDTSHDIIYSLSPEGVLLFVSPAWTHLLGHPVADVSGHNFTEFVHPEDLPACNTFHQKVLEAGERQEDVEYRVRHADGQWRWHTSSATPLRDAAGVVTGFTGIARDITERKKAEEALVRVNQKLNLLSGITRHDIKNQLLSLNGFLAISKKYCGDAAKMSEFITKEEKIAQTMEHQIAFTKEYEAIGVNAPVWHDCRSLFETAAKQIPPGKVSVKNDVPSGFEVFADPLIVKVWYNLMDNAVRHGGKITGIRFSVDNRNGDPVIVCEDDGAGVPAGEKERIFERGFGKNTGLGLFLSREILSITGITISETGEPGKGARFEIVVPKGEYRINNRV